MLSALEHEILRRVVILEVGAVELETWINIFEFCALVYVELSLHAQQLIEHFIQFLALKIQNKANDKDELQDNV